uniref:Uncharacterized protein n=1 Tax=Photinus pyralis TaxID=7054 RepID=A0A1Y1LV70_PHOPY
MGEKCKMVGKMGRRGRRGNGKPEQRFRFIFNFLHKYFFYRYSTPTNRQPILHFNSLSLYNFNTCSKEYSLLVVLRGIMPASVQHLNLKITQYKFGPFKEIALYIFDNVWQQCVAQQQHVCIKAFILANLPGSIKPFNLINFRYNALP